MMHGPEKSDLCEVAKKPANACEGPQGESVERRQGAEGNTGKAGMRRTPSQISMFSGLDRVRERARQRRRSGTPRCFTMSTLICCGRRSSG